MSKDDLLIAVCSHRVVSAPTVHSLDLLRLAQLNHHINFNYSLGLFVGDALISRCRSQAATKFLEQTDIPYMLFLDDDIIFQPKDVSKIIDDMKEGYDVIGGIYPVRGASQLSSYGWSGTLEVDGQIREVEFLATGFMGISRKVLIKIKDELKLPLLNPNDWSRCYPFFEAGRTLSEEREKGGDSIYISEDWDFAQKARKVGTRIYADTSIQLGHLREEVFTPEDVKRNQMQAIMQKQTYGAMEHQGNLMLSIDTDLSEFLKMPLPAVQRRMGIAQKELAQEWEKRQNSIDFYKDNETYLFDLATFNRDKLYFQTRLGQLLNIKGIKILDIGCGIGTAVFSLAEQGNEIVGWDINQKCIDFCLFKKKKYSLGGEFTTEKPDYSQFDLIIAIDVLEHIENLEQFILELGSEMKYGAKFYHSDCFPRGEGIWPMHYEEHATKLDDWLKQAQLIAWDLRWCIKS